jgi:hypothetical protein
MNEATGYGGSARKRKIEPRAGTLKLLQQALDRTLLFDDLEVSGVQLLLLLRQLRSHPGAIHAHP